MAEEKKAKMAQGVVVSAAMNQTAVVKVERRVQHKLYGKVMTRSTKFHAHDADNQCAVGDKVRIAQSKPYSKTKTWVLVDVVEKAQ